MLLINVFNYDINQPIRDQSSDLPSVYISFSMNWIIPAPREKPESGHAPDLGGTTVLHTGLETQAFFSGGGGLT